MGIEQANQALEADLNETTSNDVQTSNEGGQPQGPIDLDTIEKVTWKGKEYTPSQFEKMMMFQSDYTKKTQSLSETQKYYDNLEHDLEAVRGNPKLAAEFQKIYPQQFHKYLKNVMPADWGNKKEDTAGIPHELKSELDQLKNYVREEQISREEAKIENITSKLAQKYPDALEDVVLAKAQALTEQGHTLTQEMWDKLYKTSHDFMVKKMSEKQNKTFTDQRNANQKGRGIGPGGGTPGQAPAKRTFSQATDAAIQDLTGKR